MKFTLKCCGKINPIGIDKEHIRISYETDGNTEILAYSVQIASSHAKLTEGRYDVGVFESKDDSSREMWLDQAYFKERTKYYWKVTALTQSGYLESEDAYFETGISNWSADWICAEKSGQNVYHFKKDFCASDKVKEARLYICGLGYFTASINEGQIKGAD